MLIIGSLFITRVIINVSHKQLVSDLANDFAIISVQGGPTFVVAFKLFHANWRKTRGSGKKSSFFGPKKSAAKRFILTLNTSVNFICRETSPATVYIYVDFATDPGKLVTLTEFPRKVGFVLNQLISTLDSAILMIIFIAARTLQRNIHH